MFKILRNIFFLIIFLSSCSQQLVNKENINKEKSNKVSKIKIGGSAKTGILISQ